jgi:DNA primase
MSRLVVSIIEFPYEVSPNWQKNYEMPVPTREDNYKEEIISTLSYLELKKIKKLIDLNQKELETSTSPERQLLLIQTHVRLKDLETKLTKEIGAVILK